MTTRANNDRSFYVTFEKLDKRFDCWLEPCHLQIFTKKVEEPKLVLQTRRSKLVSSEKSALFENPIETLFENEHTERTKVKYIERVSLGLDLTLDTWYASPYPQEYEKV